MKRQIFCDEEEWTAQNVAISITFSKNCHRLKITSYENARKIVYFCA